MIEGLAIAAWTFPVLFGGEAPAIATPQEADSLAIDLSRHEVSVALDYTGAELVLFGATEGAGDIVVEIRGPLRAEVVRHKERIAGIWLNSDEMVFGRVPAFYAVASSAPLEQVLPPEERAQHRIGIDNLWLPPSTPGAEERVRAFREALVRNKQRIHLFPVEPAEVRFVGNRLFRTDVHFPPSASVGPYDVRVFLVRDGRIVSQKATPLILSRVGFGARVFHLAHENSAFYGVLAIAIAVMAGWLASIFFRSKA